MTMQQEIVDNVRENRPNATLTENQVDNLHYIAAITTALIIALMIQFGVVSSAVGFVISCLAWGIMRHHIRHLVGENEWMLVSSKRPNKVLAIVTSGIYWLPFNCKTTRVTKQPIFTKLSIDGFARNRQPVRIRLEVLVKVRDNIAKSSQDVKRNLAYHSANIQQLVRWVSTTPIVELLEK